MSAASAGAGPTRDLRVDLDFACTLADAARPIALSRFRAGASIDNKIASGFDPVTEADRGVEAELRRRLAEGRPDDAILGEEAAPLPGRSGRTWVLDPVDGTRAFIAGLPTWCVLIALSGPDGPLLSVVDQPFTEERFSAIAGQGAWLDHKGVRRPIRASACETVSRAILSTTDPGLFAGAEADAFDALASRT
ncbi:MAG: inositol monophosphatase family protein, partial [Oceanicaulis sp.]